MATEIKHSFIRRFFGWLWRHKWWSLTVIILLLIGGTWWIIASIGDKVEYVTVGVTRGDIKHVVTATGEINPVNTVSVGSQVSGTISNIYVDYNSHVTKGQLLLEIDPSVLQATVDEARAALDSAKSQLNLARNDYERNKTLYDSGYVARAEMEQSQTNYELFLGFLDGFGDMCYIL